MIRSYQRFLAPLVRYHMTEPKTADLCMGMRNTFLATKVAFVNQFYDLAQTCGVDYRELREVWLADERIGRLHTILTEERGYRGRCLPKEIAAIIHGARQVSGAPLLEAIAQCNEEDHRRDDKKRGKWQTTPAGPKLDK